MRNNAAHVGRQRAGGCEAANQSIGRRLSFGRVSRKPSSTMSAAPPSTTQPRAEPPAQAPSPEPLAAGEAVEARSRRGWERASVVEVNPDGTPGAFY